MGVLPFNLASLQPLHVCGLARGRICWPAWLLPGPSPVPSVACSPRRRSTRPRGTTSRPP
ncbi:hypothetical protein FRIGORI9N_270063 [Frigoribacterium sp. 9N]|nr:hypothetical protein FRIGORI9N_270063 [Frigoribacterium sp. 9N]